MILNFRLSNFFSLRDEMSLNHQAANIHIRKAITRYTKRIQPTIAYFLIAIVTLSCNGHSDIYHVFYNDDSITIQRENGMIVFPIKGETVVSGVEEVGTIQPGSWIKRTFTDSIKTQVVTIEYLSSDSSLQIITCSTYHKDCMIENDGLFGDCSGDIGLKRDENVFVDGTPVLVGFTDESKTKFAICPVYGELTSHYSKLDEFFY